MRNTKEESLKRRIAYLPTCLPANSIEKMRIYGVRYVVDTSSSDRERENDNDEQRSH